MISLAAWFPIGLLIGVIGAMLGVGGGFLLIPLLLMAHPEAPPSAVTAISLAIISLNALSSVAAYAGRRMIQWRTALVCSATSLPGAALGDFVNARLGRTDFVPVFAVLLVALALYVAVRSRGARAGEAPKAPSVGLAGAAAASVGIGFIAAFFGIGGGVLQVPLLVYGMGMGAHHAVATAQVVLAATAVFATGLNLGAGELNSYWQLVLVVGVAVIAGAQLGVRLGAKVDGKWLMRGLALVLMIAALKLLV